MKVGKHGRTGWNNLQPPLYQSKLDTTDFISYTKNPSTPTTIIATRATAPQTWPWILSLPSRWTGQMAPYPGTTWKLTRWRLSSGSRVTTRWWWMKNNLIDELANTSHYGQEVRDMSLDILGANTSTMDAIQDIFAIIHPVVYEYSPSQVHLGQISALSKSQGSWPLRRNL